MSLNTKLSLNRRHTLSLLAATLAGAVAPVLAQGGPQEGIDYLRLPTRVPTPSGKIDVVAFFLYGSKHSDTFEEVLQPWIKRLPANVGFRYVPPDFSLQGQLHQRLFYTLQAMGVEHQMRAAIFNAIHVRGNPLVTLEAMIKLLAPLGLDENKFTNTFKSIVTNAKIAQVNSLVKEYRINSVPCIGIGGIYVTSTSMGNRGGGGKQHLQTHA
nr:thiol:disulfide interchange protein DsbA/DsbL [uncultured Undibacterium sp.]